MILEKRDFEKYRKEFQKRFTSFGEKAPILLSFITDDKGVTVIHENSGTKYFYPWDLSLSVQSFIHQIKQDISYKHYPLILRTETSRVPYTSEEQASLLAEGKNIEDIPAFHEVTKKTICRIDKIVALKDEFILLEEGTGRQFSYKMNTSSIFFLKKYREGFYKSLEEASDDFFKKSTLIAELGKTKKTN